MSYRATAWAYDLRLIGSQKFVLVALADMADEAGSCYPGQERLVEMTGLSESTVRRSLKRLEQQGLLEREARYDRHGHRTSDRYYLQTTVTVLPTPPTAPDVDPADPEPDAAVTDPTPAPVENSPTGQSDRRSPRPRLPVTVTAPTGHRDRHIKEEPPGEPPGEPSGGAPTSPTCGQHPAGTTRPCRACGDARRRWDAHQARPTPPARSAWRPGLCRAHLQREDACEACHADARRAALEAFGVPA